MDSDRQPKSYAKEVSMMRLEMEDRRRPPGKPHVALVGRNGLTIRDKLLSTVKLPTALTYLPHNSPDLNLLAYTSILDLWCGRGLYIENNRPARTRSLMMSSTCVCIHSGEQQGKTHKSRSQNVAGPGMMLPFSHSSSILSILDADIILPLARPQYVHSCFCFGGRS